ncbi:alpha/beta fold hydrolase [Glycomyces halotolerans]
MSTAVACFPPAAAGPSFFAGLRGSAAMSVVAVDLPGKEKRCTEPAPDTVEAIVDGCLPQLESLAAEHDDLILFGHCFGALLAHRAATLLDGATAARLSLAVSGSPPPGTRDWDDYSGLDGAAFVDAMARVAGRRNPALDDPELREFLLPTARADVAAHERYRPEAATLSIPVLALRGDRDALVTDDRNRAWAKETTGPFSSRDMPGDHLYLLERWPELEAALKEAL